jgi:hypothetical protein
MTISIKAYARCTACNIRHYPSWDSVRKEFEPLCTKCLDIAKRSSRTDHIVYHEGVIDAWVNKSPNDDQKYLDALLVDQIEATGSSLWKEDEYLTYGSEAFGNIGLFDKY